MLGLGLDADAVGPLDVAAGQGPQDPDHEDHAEEVGGGRVALVHGAVEELQRFGELVVDFEHHGGDEENQEPEVDERVHDAGGRVPQQRLHPHRGAEVLHASLGVLLRGATVVGLAAFVVANTQ